MNPTQNITDADTSPKSKSPAQPTPANKQEPWTVDDALELYRIDRWGAGFFGINDKGNVVVHPDPNSGAQADIYEIVRGLVERGMNPPIQIGLMDVLAKQISRLATAFQNAIKENNYKAGYHAVYPVKVNHQRHLVEQVSAEGLKHNFGLEVGSKPELLAVMGLTADHPDRLIICNGFKEERYIKHVMMAAKLGRTIIPVIENTNELKLIADAAKQLNIKPHIGVRVRLSQSGSGKWSASSGEKAKFGLSIPALLRAVEFLKERDMLDCLQLLHCHIGSQISDIRTVNTAVGELTQIYKELIKAGADMQYLDIGGGLGVDYSGTRAASGFSINYDLNEYANDVVYRIMSVCDESDVKHPTIISESGRAMVSHHSLLVFEAMSASGAESRGYELNDATINKFAEAECRPLDDLVSAYHSVGNIGLLESYHDAVHAKEEALTLFNVGHLSLENLANIDRLYWATSVKIRDIAIQQEEELPEELRDLTARLSDSYFCNLSLFQSLPDTWAIGQTFPIMPIHRLNEQPTRRGTLVDITCDSDGKIDCFIGERGAQPTLALHEVDENEPYYIGAFLTGAYQETLGDLHNLFGDPHVAHVRIDDQGRWSLDQFVEGDTVSEVLTYLQYDIEELRRSIRKDCENAVQSGRMTPAESKQIVDAYTQGLAGYTYLE